LQNPALPEEERKANGERMQAVAKANGEKFAATIPKSSELERD
jgi:hypothetical protein